MQLLCDITFFNLNLHCFHGPFRYSTRLAGLGLRSQSAVTWSHRNTPSSHRGQDRVTLVKWDAVPLLPYVLYVISQWPGDRSMVYFDSLRHCSSLNHRKAWRWLMWYQSASWKKKERERKTSQGVDCFRHGHAIVQDKKIWALEGALGEQERCSHYFAIKLLKMANQEASTPSTSNTDGHTSLKLSCKQSKMSRTGPWNVPMKASLNLKLILGSFYLDLTMPLRYSFSQPCVKNASLTYVDPMKGS